MGKTLGLAWAALGAALLGAAPTEHMLCVHQDGRVFLEAYQEDCCASDAATEEPSRCPDDRCRDLPLALDADGSLDVPSVETSPAVVVGLLPILTPEVARPRETPAPRAGGLDPPASPPPPCLRI